MKAAVEVPHGRLSDRELPSKSLVAQKLEQVEDNAPCAEDMRDVTSLEDAESEAYNAIIDPSTAVLRIKPGKTTTTPPGTPEELRLRHRRIGLAWEMVRARHSTRSWLPDRCVDAYRRLSDHVLGSRVAGLRSGDGQGPSWTLVLKYEAEVRKQAYRLIRDSEAPDLAAALSAACKCPEILTNHFVIPFSLERHDMPKEREGVHKDGSLDARVVDALLAKLGKGRGKGKDTSVTKTVGKHQRSSDGKRLCYAFNKAKGCARKDCPFLHACQRCLGHHSYAKCPLVKRPTGAPAEDVE